MEELVRREPLLKEKVLGWNGCQMVAGEGVDSCPFKVKYRKKDSGGWKFAGYC
ncbi:hypothetical protein L6252_03090 [Candidatus Parcubacteria bacterium]|nr:hypothetical protein [Candidatus Parcubacteria bacterium]